MSLDPDHALSPGFTLADLIRSETAQKRGIDNTPPAELLPNLQRLAEGLDRIQALLGAPLEISSGYRSPELNTAVGGTATSQHCQGLAADFVCPGFGEPMSIAQALAASDLDYDQAILEFGKWIHVSFTASPRKRLLTIYDSNEGYLDGLVDRDGTRIV